MASMQFVIDMTELERARSVDPLLHYARHFGLLALFSAALATPGWRAQLGIAAQFALFGALHAAALVLSVRACAGIAAGRRLLFLAIAACWRSRPPAWAFSGCVR